jgi:osmotically-inducible protein OsmY
MIPAPATFSTSSAMSELAQLRLRESPYYFLRTLTCHFDRGVLTLKGTVPQHRLRGIAERIVARVDGVHTINNQIEVHDPAVWRRSA